MGRRSLSTICEGVAYELFFKAQAPSEACAALTLQYEPNSSSGKRGNNHRRYPTELILRTNRVSVTHVFGVKFGGHAVSSTILSGLNDGVRACSTSIQRQNGIACFCKVLPTHRLM